MTRANWTPPFKADRDVVKDAMGLIVARVEQEPNLDATDAAFRAKVIADALTAQVTPKALLIIIERLVRQLMALETERDALLAAHKPTEAALLEVAQAARRKALEEAAEACLVQRWSHDDDDDEQDAYDLGRVDGAKSCADAIRALMKDGE